ncbi:MAG: helix-turn-helix domain-containing protein [Polyangiales bacterium]
MYLELPTRSSSPLLVCRWTQTATSAGDARILPDACIDVIWNGASLFVAGPDTHAVAHAVVAGARYAAVRFAPGMAPSVLGVPASAIRDARVDLVDLWGDAARRLRDRLSAARGVRAATCLLEEAITETPRTQAVDPLVRRVVARLSADPSWPAARLAAELGVGERQLLRRCDAAFGYGPKLLARILRFQRALAALRAQPRGELAALATAHGYADQAHLAHDVRLLAGVAPSVLRGEIAMSDLDKRLRPMRDQTESHDHSYQR